MPSPMEAAYTLDFHVSGPSTAKGEHKAGNNFVTVPKPRLAAARYHRLRERNSIDIARNVTIIASS